MSPRTAAVLALLIAGTAIGCRSLGDDQPLTAALKLVTATLAIGVVPGALATILWRPCPQVSLLEVIGLGIAISFGLVQLAAMFAISVHVGTLVTLGLLAIASVLMAGMAVRRRPGAIVITFDELIVFTLLLGLSVFLYTLGSPVTWWEDQVHVAIVRRLSELGSPRLDNLYVTPGVVYTYPVPGMHYLMALIARLSDLDSLFVYHKLRFFWGPAAIVMLHLAARAVFGAQGIASAVSVSAIVLVCNGTFAMVPGFDSGWGQLATYSHVSDIAMSVLLPALMTVAFGYLMAEARRERTFFLAATALLVLTLSMVHIREIVQFAAYVGCFLSLAVATLRFRAYARRAALLLVLAVGIAAVYALWQAQVAGLVGDIVENYRARLISIVTTNSLRTLVSTPATVLLSDFLINSDQLFRNLTPLFLFAGPVIVVLFSRQPLVWLMCCSTVMYLAVMTISLLAIPYIYVTYFEILYTPVRNVVFFVYLMSGAAIYAAVAGLARIDRSRLSPLATGTFAGVLAILVTLCLNQSAGGFIAPLMMAYALVFMSLSTASVRTAGARTSVAALLAIIGAVLLLPEREVVQRVDHVSVRWVAGLPETERGALERRFSLTTGEPNSNYSNDVNVWNYAIIDRSPENIRALVNHPQVVDTNDIDRSRFTVPPQPPEGDYRYFGVDHLSWLQYPGLPLFLMTALLMWALAFVVPAALASVRGQGVITSFQRLINEPFYRNALPYALFVLPFAVLTARPTLSPLAAAPALPGGPDTPSAVIQQLPCVTTERGAERFGAVDVPVRERTTCAPHVDFVEWVRRNVPTDAVFAVDRWTAYAPQLFMPQQAVAFPAFDVTFLQEDQLFGDYYRFFDERMQRDRVQPFFNSVETPAERAAFVEALGVTHVLVNPPYYGELRSVLDALPDRFISRYDRAGWAVYEVNRKSDAGTRR